MVRTAHHTRLFQAKSNCLQIRVKSIILSVFVLRDIFLAQHARHSSHLRAFSRPRLVSKHHTIQIIGALRSQSELGTAEGRSQFLVAARPHLQKIAAPGLRLQLVKEVARIGEVTQEEAERLLGLQGESGYRKPAPARAPAAIIAATESQLLRCIVARPDCAGRVDLSLLNPELSESRLLAMISRLSGEGKSEEISQSYLIEVFRGSEHEATLHAAQRQVLDLDLNREEAEGEIAMCLLTLRIHRANKEVESLKQAVVRAIVTARCCSRRRSRSSRG